MKINLKLAGVCSVGSQETVVFSLCVSYGYAQCRSRVRQKEIPSRGLLSAPHSHGAWSCETRKNNNIRSFVIKAFVVMHEHRGGKPRSVRVQLSNNCSKLQHLAKAARG